MFFGLLLWVNSDVVHFIAAPESWNLGGLHLSVSDGSFDPYDYTWRYPIPCLFVAIDNLGVTPHSWLYSKPYFLDSSELTLGLLTGFNRFYVSECTGQFIPEPIQYVLASTFILFSFISASEEIPTGKHVSFERRNFKVSQEH